MATSEEIKLIITAEVSKAVANMHKVIDGLDGIDKPASRVSDRFKTFESNIRKTTITLLAAGYAFNKVIGIAKDFEQSIANVKAISTATTAELSKMAREAGMGTVFSAKEAGDALYFLASAGINTASAMRNVLMPALNLASAGNIGIANATDLIITQLKVFNMETEKAGEVTDIMAKTVSSANTDMEQLGYALSYSSATASQAGISFTDLNALIGVMANQGIKGTRAGVQLRMALVRLIKPTSEATKVLESYGITQAEINKLLPTPIKLFKRLNSAGMSQADMLEILGVRQANVAKLIREGVPEMEAMALVLNNVKGEAQRVAEIRMDTLEGSLKLLKSAFDEMIISMMTGRPSALDAFKSIIQIITGAIGVFNQLPDSVKSVIGIVLTLTAVTLVLTKVVIGFGVAFSAAIWPVTAIVAAIAAVVIIVKLLKNNWSIVTAAFKIGILIIIRLWEQFKSVAKITGLSIAAFMLKAASTMVSPFIKAINLIIQTYNRLRGTNIATMNNIVAQSNETVNAQIAAERRKLIESRKVNEEEKAAINEFYAAKQEKRRAEQQAELEDNEEHFAAKQEQKTIQDDQENSVKSEKDQKLIDDEKKKRDKLSDIQKQEAEQRKQNYLSWSGFIQDSLDKDVKWQFNLWKAFAIQQAIMQTQEAAMAGYRAMVGIPVVGPGLAIAAAAAAIGFGGARVAKIASTQPPKAFMGGFVPGSPGGTTVTVGERGQSEAIVPLDNPQAQERLGGIGGGTTLILNVENLYATEDMPRELIEKIDQGLWDLRRTKNSAAFDGI